MNKMQGVFGFMSTQVNGSAEGTSAAIDTVGLET